MKYRRYKDFHVEIEFVDGLIYRRVAREKTHSAAKVAIEGKARAEGYDGKIKKIRWTAG